MRNLLIFLLLTCNFTLFSQDSNRLKQIDDLIQSDQYEEAIKKCEQGLANEPKNPDILRRIGYVYFMTENNELSEKYLTAAIAEDPKCINCLVNLAFTYSNLNNSKKAIDNIDKAVALDPQNPDIYIKRAKLKKELNDKFGALSDFEKAIELDPKIYDYYYVRGLYYIELGYLASAFTDFNKAISIDPKIPDAYIARASLYGDQNKLDLAFIDLNKAIQLDSNAFKAYYGRGMMYYRTNQNEKALKDFNKAISLYGDEAQLYYERANVNYSLEKMDDACQDLKMVKSYIDKGLISDKQVVDYANNLFSELCFETNPGYYFHRGIAEYNLDQFDKAIDIYKIGVKHFPKHAMMRSFKGNAHLELHQYDEALTEYEFALKNKENIITEARSSSSFANKSSGEISNFYFGTIANIHYTSAECYAFKGQYEKALVEINKTNEIEFTSAKLGNFEHLKGFLLMNLGKNELAIKEFDKCLEIDKTILSAYINRAIAKIGMSQELELTSYSYYGINAKNQKIFTWSHDEKSEIKINEETILSAISDCDKAISYDENLGFAYYIRGQIKKIANRSDYCLDILTAKEKGVVIDKKLLSSCGQ